MRINTVMPLSNSGVYPGSRKLSQKNKNRLRTSQSQKGRKFNSYA